MSMLVKYIEDNAVESYKWRWKTKENFIPLQKL